MKKGRAFAILGLVVVAGMVAASIAGALSGGSTNTTPTNPVTTQAPNSTQVAVGSSFNGKTVQLNVGQPLEITLDSNATTGFKWTLLDGTDPAILEQTGQSYIGPKTDLVGAGGQESWDFKALAKGQTTISMSYARPWESVPPVQTFTLTVNVQ